ncbi:MAG: hypothetical protein IJP91_07715 [Synergistaceae bacterium]|nr:hypothetical protein [Synergistaceae bacterium]
MFVTVYITLADYWKLKRDDILKFYSGRCSLEKIADKWILPKIGMLKVTDITSNDIESVIRDIYEHGEPKYVVSWANAIFRKIFHEAAVDKLIKDDVCDGLQPVISDSTDKRIFSEEQEISLLRAFQRTSQPELLTLSMITGLQYTELSASRREDYSGDEKTLTINKKRKTKGSPETVVTKRAIPLSDISCAILNRAVVKQVRKNRKFPGNESELIFTNHFNNPIIDLGRENYAKIRKESGIYDFMMKDLSSNFGVHAMKYKVNPVALKRYMGYETGKSINDFSAACHDKSNVKDIKACDDYYRGLKGHDNDE